MTSEPNIISLESYRTERGFTFGLPFAHVLNVPSSEELWPGDFAEILFPLLFAVRLSGEGLYVLDNYVHEHMRCEILRLCWGRDSALDHMENEIEFYCNMEAAYANMFSDCCEDEPDISDSRQPKDD